MSSYDITLITPTGNRPEAFKNLVQFMSSQTYKGRVQWVIVDDGEPEITIPSIWEFTPKKAIDIEVKLLQPLALWIPGINTQKQNLLLALEAVESDFIFIIEDDDWYPPEYLDRMMMLFSIGATVAGELNSLYYYLPTASYKWMNNCRHCSLCQTAFSRYNIPLFKEALAANVKYYDVEFWRLIGERCVEAVTYWQSTVVGIKGMPGRPGIGVGHTKHEGYIEDKHLSLLNAATNGDWKRYEEYLPQENVKRAVE